MSLQKSKADVLASVAFLALVARGKACQPSLHDIAVAVVQSAPLLDLDPDPAEWVHTEIEATARLCERHNWCDGIPIIIER